MSRLAQAKTFRIAAIAIVLAMAAAGAAPVRAATGTSSVRKGATRHTGVASSAAVKGTPTVAREAQPENRDLTLKGGQEGTAFRSLTVEGEDRVHLDFDRPSLDLELDPQQAPGLDWGSARDVLDRTTPDLLGPLLGLSATQASPYLARPWLSEFASGAVARFTPEVEHVERWKLTVANSKGETVATYTGKGDPPRAIQWDGRTSSGLPVPPGLTYSYVFEAFDKAGNKRNFVGPGFEVPPYRLESPEGPILSFAARNVFATSAGPSGGAPESIAPPIVLEAASWLNQSGNARQPLRVTATARTAEQGQLLAAAVMRSLAPHLIGDPARVRPVVVVETDAPEGGTVTITPGR